MSHASHYDSAADVPVHACNRLVLKGGVLMQTANRITMLVLGSALLLEVVGFLGAEGLLLHHNLKLLWCACSLLMLASVADCSYVVHLQPHSFAVWLCIRC